MSRRINTGPRATRAGSALGTPTRDDFLTRLIKYIPAEIVGLYVAVRGAVPHEADPAVLWWLALGAWVLVPVYFWVATTRGGTPPMILQIVFASLAFPVWVFAIGGSPVTSWAWFNEHQYVASIALMFLTVIFGWFEPRPGT
jgi:hypothetical protein